MVLFGCCDVAISLSGPISAPSGSAFTETVTVTNLGLSNATGIATNVYIPALLTLIDAPGATVESGTLDWVDPSLAPGQSVVYLVTLERTAASGVAVIGAVAKGIGYDANPTNNAAITTVAALPGS